MKALAPCLPHLDILFMNEDEARMATGATTAGCAAQVVLRQGVKTAVIKLSARGCAIYPSDDEILCSAFDVAANDTTGAGDCFVAGFLAARHQRYRWQDAGRFANAAGALSVQKLGAVSGMLPFREVEEWMRTAPQRELGPAYL